jgi:hypothetical protein
MKGKERKGKEMIGWLVACLVGWFGSWGIGWVRWAGRNQRQVWFWLMKERD